MKLEEKKYLEFGCKTGFFGGTENIYKEFMKYQIMTPKTGRVYFQYLSLKQYKMLLKHSLLHNVYLIYQLP